MAFTFLFAIQQITAMSKQDISYFSQLKPFVNMLIPKL